MNDLLKFTGMVADHFQEIAAASEVFVTGIDGTELWEHYLAAFPAGSDPIFKTRTEHDCSTCRHFIRRVGMVVSFGSNGKLRTVWDHAAQEAPYPYREIAEHLRSIVTAVPIADLFRVGAQEISFGAKQTRSLDKDSGRAVTWNHLYTGEIPKKLRSMTPDAIRGHYRTTVAVFERGLLELAPSAVDTVLGLIETNALYRGEEHKPAVVAFRNMQGCWIAQPRTERSRFAWADAGSPAARFRNTVIGTLVQDLSEGVDLEHAVKSFETKVAPQNYKRTTALITPGMVKKAMETIVELGLGPALERRFAVMEDISVNDVLWVDVTARGRMKGGLEGALLKYAYSAAGKAPDPKNTEEISLDDFITRVLPETTGLELLFQNEHAGNLMSLTAPLHPEPKQLFRWSNDFAWSYGGNVADSIKERVKKAGGRVEDCVLRVSLSWFNYDDLDLHIIQPPGRGMTGLENRIYFRNKRGYTGGVLDVDMNAGQGSTREAVENVTWEKTPPDGDYRVIVNNYCFRESSNPGFVVEIESAGGKLTHFTYNKAVRNMADVEVAVIRVRGGAVESIEITDPSITVGSVWQEKWGLTTGQYVKVQAVTLSPNYWGANKVGNKHTFFVLDGAVNDEATRGFYNEFLHPRLEPHRKVFEVIADKTKCGPSDKQLSGLGFSSTKAASFTVRSQNGKKQRIFNIQVKS